MPPFEEYVETIRPLWDSCWLTNMGTYHEELAKKLAASAGWNRNTTYTVIKKLVDKGAVSRSDPGFLCAPLVSREDVQRAETDNLITRLFGGSNSQFLSAFFSGRELTPAEAGELRSLIERLERGDGT